MTHHKRNFPGTSNASKRGDQRISLPTPSPLSHIERTTISIHNRTPMTQTDKFYARYPTYDPASANYKPAEERINKDSRKGYQ